MGSFNISTKNGTASSNTIYKFVENEKGYRSRKERAIRFANQTIGKDFLTEYGCPKNFDASKIGEKTYEQRCLQQIAMPFSNEKISEFVNTPKYVFGKPFYGKIRGKNVYACNMYAKNGDQDLVFLLQIISGTQENANIDFSIKLDMLVSGKEWFALARLDSIGANHPNYIVGGKVMPNPKQVEFAPTPHIHLNSEEVQVIACDKNCEYTTAFFVPELKAERSSHNPYYFKSCMNVVSEFLNIKTPINKKIEKDYKFGKYDDLFEPSEVISSSIISKVSEKMEEKLSQAQSTDDKIKNIENSEVGYGL